MSLGEPQFPRRLAWWEYAEAKTTFLIYVGLIGAIVFIAVLMYSLWPNDL